MVSQDGTGHYFETVVFAYGVAKSFTYSKAHGEKAWLGGVAAMGDFS